MKKFLTENKLGPYAKAKVKEDMGHDIEDAEAEKQMDFLAEREVIYTVNDGKCYRVDDEGNQDEVDYSYCKKYANEAKEEEQFGGVNETVDQAKVQEMYDKITAVISKAAKKLSDDDASALHDKLKSFFNKLFETKKPVEESMDINKIASADDKLRRLISNISTNSNIPTADKEGLLDALSELQDFVDEVGFDAEVGQDEEPVSDYSRRRQNELSENLSSNNVQTLSSDHIQLIQNIIDNYSDGGIYADPAMDRIERIINGDLSMEDPEDGGTFKYENVNEESVRMFKSDNPEGDKLVLQFLKGIAKKFDYPVQQAALFVKERIKKLGY